MKTTDPAYEIETVATVIVTNFWTDQQYRNGITQKQIYATANF